MRRRFMLATMVTWVVLALGSMTPAGSTPNLGLADGALPAGGPAGAGADATGPRLDHFELLSHLDPLGIKDYGDLWVNDDVAYEGTRCGGHLKGGYGVQVVDIADPSAPVVASTLPNPRFTRAEDVVVHDVDTPSFQGALALVGVQSCFGNGVENRVRTGLMLYDVTDPYEPSLLSVWFLKGFSAGCHEIDLVQRPDGMVLAGCAQNLNDQIYGQTALDLVDVTDPRSPALVGTYSLPLDPLSGVGCIPVTFGHSVRFEDQGTTALLSYWDYGGTVNLDISDPTSPAEVGTTLLLPADEDGDNHSAIYARGGQWLIVNNEDFCPDTPGQVGFGEVHVFDNSDPAHTTLLGTFFTKNTHTNPPLGEYSAHNTEIWSEMAESSVEFMSSWYSDGIVWWRMGQDGTATQLGQFVPGRSGGLPFTWGVAPVPDRNLVVASDIGSGLWIVRPTT